MYNICTLYGPLYAKFKFLDVHLHFKTFVPIKSAGVPNISLDQLRDYFYCDRLKQTGAKYFSRDLVNVRLIRENHYTSASVYVRIPRLGSQL